MRFSYGGQQVSQARWLLCIVTLSLWSWATTARPQQGGPVSSSAPGVTSATNTSKSLPWKFLASPMGVLGPEWTEATIKGFSNDANWVCTKTKQDCTPQKISALVKDTFGAGLTARKAKSAYVAIHVVDYGSGSQSLSDSWYLYHFQDKKWSFQKFTDTRIYGSDSIMFLFLHLYTKSVSLNDAENQVRISQTLTPAQRSSLTTELLENGVRANLLQIPQPGGAQPGTAIPICEKDTGDQFQWFGEYGVPTTYANVHYESAVVKRTPANVANLLSILKILGLATAQKKCIAITAATDVIVWGAGEINNIGLPSDVSIAGYRTPENETLKDEERSKFQIGTIGAFNDEQLYWWDASIGIPVHTIKDLQYSSSDDTVVATQVDKQSAYAMFNLMLHPVDLSNPRSNIWPRILAGFPLSSSPWQKLFAGGGIGIPWKPVQNFQFFSGATFNRSSQPTTLTAGSTASPAQLENDLRIKTTPKFTFGINVPVKSVIDKLTK
jgi:hypothetical protein